MESRRDLVQATLWFLWCVVACWHGIDALLVCESSLWKALIYSALEVVGGVAAAGVFKVTHEAGSTRKRKTSP